MLNKLFQRTKTAVAEITPAELQKRLANQEGLLLLDVRSSGEYAHDGHIAGSRLLPLDNLAARSSELPLDRPIVCICRSGGRSRMACETLAKQGFSQMINLRGGMMAWKRAGLPTS